jgi:hypothetical protein
MTDKVLKEEDFVTDTSCRHVANLAREFSAHLKKQGKTSATFGELRDFDRSRVGMNCAEILRTVVDID